MERDGLLGGMSAEPAVQELDGVDGVGAGAVEDLLAAGGARRNDHCRNLLPGRCPNGRILRPRVEG